MENKIDVSQEACERRLTERRGNEARILNKIATVFCCVAVISILLTSALVVVAIIEKLNIVFVIIAVLFSLLFLYFAGDALEKKKKIEAMSNEEYIKEQTKALKRSNVDQTVCPCCGSAHVTFHKKGFNEGKALLGVALIGYWGAFWGVPGKNKIKGTCLKCGHSWTVKRK